MYMRRHKMVNGFVMTPCRIMSKFFYPSVPPPSPSRSLCYPCKICWGLQAGEADGLPRKLREKVFRIVGRLFSSFGDLISVGGEDCILPELQVNSNIL